MKKIFSGIKAVGFDVDGTLYHSSEEMRVKIGRQVLQAAAKGLNKQVSEIEEEFLKRRKDLRSTTLTLNSFGLDGEKIFQRMWDEFPVEKYVEKDEKLVAMISELKKKYRLFVLSNGTERQVVRKLEYLGLSKRDFDPFVCGYDHGWVKPEPAPFLFALEQLELEPGEVVYVGDREQVDIEAAKAVGMKTIFVGGEYEGADVYCETVYDILNVL